MEYTMTPKELCTDNPYLEHNQFSVLLFYMDNQQKKTKARIVEKISNASSVSS